jgi:hypothetical protein
MYLLFIAKEELVGISTYILPIFRLVGNSTRTHVLADITSKHKPCRAFVLNIYRL